MLLNRAFSFAKNLSLHLFILILNSKPAWALSGNLDFLDNQKEPLAPPMPDMFSLLVKLVVSLIIVGGLAYLTIQFLKKNGQIVNSSESITVLDQFALGMNKGLFIIEVTDKVLVLGVTDHNINILYEVTDKETIKELQERAEERENNTIMPPKLLDMIMSRAKNTNSSQVSFSNHIQEQINRLRVTVKNPGDKFTGEDEGNGQDER